ncbi:Leucine-rich repeat [Macleaya cordata]|uniref:Leucine-rich repeat n=1 Tax=Macleaya cordata TaxID=56857 RepID=A0A200QEC3_MACCD|nr:Leucine-rich repeat [Macleaya cordata]
MGSLKHLRYLDLFGCYKLEALPESISELCSLQTLNLEICTNLTKLPKDMKKLINLRHIKLDIWFGCEYVMPSGIRHLTNLQTLSELTVGKDTTEASVVELERLNLLKGTLNIRNLHNVTDAMDAQRANLKEKQNLHNLELHWMSSKFASCFPFLEKISIAHCPKLISIPTVFPFLKELNVDYSNLTTISSIVNKALTTLTTICVSSAPELIFLPQGLLLNNNLLESLEIRDCPKFQGFFTNNEEEENKEELQIEIYDPHFISSSSLVRLKIHDCPELSFLPDLRHLRSLESLCIQGCQGLKSSLDGLRCLNSLQEIKIGWFSEELNIFPTVSINEAEEEEEGTNIQHYYFISLKSLTIDGGTKNKCLPEYLQYLTTLQYLKLKNVEELVDLPEWLGNLSSLKYLSIFQGSHATPNCTTYDV